MKLMPKSSAERPLACYQGNKVIKNKWRISLLIGKPLGTNFEWSFFLSVEEGEGGRGVPQRASVCVDLKDFFLICGGFFI